MLGAGLLYFLVYVTPYFAILKCDKLGTSSAFTCGSISAVDNEDTTLILLYCRSSAKLATLTSPFHP
jgi:hypothetical protein